MSRPTFFVLVGLLTARSGSLLADDQFNVRNLYCVTEASAGVDQGPAGRRAVSDAERTFFVRVRMPKNGSGWGDLHVNGGSIGAAIIFDTKDGVRFSSSGPPYAVLRLTTGNKFVAAWVDEVEGTDEPMGYVIEGKCTEVPR